MAKQYKMIMVTLLQFADKAHEKSCYDRVMVTQNFFNKKVR